MQPFRIYLCALFALLQLPAVLATPPQRLIIQFDISLNAEQKQTLNQQLHAIIQSDFSVLPHSTEQMWIIVINPPLDTSRFDKMNAEISQLQHIQYVELDQVMNRLHQK